MLSHCATPKETGWRGEVKLVAPVTMTQRERKKEEMPSCSQAMQCKPLLHVPPTSTPTESAVLGDGKNSLREQQKNQCQTMLSSEPRHQPHSSWPLLKEDKDIRRSDDCGSLLLIHHFPKPRKTLMC